MSNITLEDRFLTVREVADLLKVHRNTIIKLIKEGKLVAVRFRNYRVVARSLVDYLSRQVEEELARRDGGS
ncbi:MAG: helix-turn-helix domain-containing protein [Candidatus Micrarchaeota archaeon]